jgi:hypothetical protein
MISKVLSRSARVGVLATLLTLSGPLSAEIIWSGDFEPGNFNQWHAPGAPGSPDFSAVPAYGRPAPEGDGSLLSITSSPVRQGTRSAKFTVKNSSTGSEPADCNGADCTTRRTEVLALTTIPDQYNALPYLEERWLSFSVYVPSDWNDSSGNGVLNVFQVHPRNGSAPPFLSFEMRVEGWRINHRVSDQMDPTAAQVPLQQQMYYTANYPTSTGDWPDGLLDFPNVTASRTALGTIRRGQWTDWVIQTKLDALTGSGFLRVWQRWGTSSWVQVLEIQPKTTRRGTLTFERGIGYYVPSDSGGEGANGGYGLTAGLSMDKTQVWTLTAPRVVYLDNIKIGDETATFDQMTPEAVASGSRPKAPTSALAE